MAALIGRVVVKRRMAAVVAAAEAAASGRAAAQAAQDRLRFLARLDHELKNPLTAMRAAAGKARAPSPAPGFPFPAVPGPRPVSQICDSAATPPAKPHPSLLINTTKPLEGNLRA